MLGFSKFVSSLSCSLIALGSVSAQQGVDSEPCETNDSPQTTVSGFSRRKKVFAGARLVGTSVLLGCGYKYGNVIRGKIVDMLEARKQNKIKMEIGAIKKDIESCKLVTREKLYTILMGSSLSDEMKDKMKKCLDSNVWITIVGDEVGSIYFDLNFGLEGASLDLSSKRLEKFCYLPSSIRKGIGEKRIMSSKGGLIYSGLCAGDLVEDLIVLDNVNFVFSDYSRSYFVEMIRVLLALGLGSYNCYRDNCIDKPLVAAIAKYLCEKKIFVGDNRALLDKLFGNLNKRLNKDINIERNRLSIKNIFRSDEDREEFSGVDVPKGK